MQRGQRVLSTIMSVCALVGWGVQPGKAAGAGLDTAKIEQLTGVKGEFNQREGVFTVRVPGPISP